MALNPKHNSLRSYGAPPFFFLSRRFSMELISQLVGDGVLITVRCRFLYSVWLCDRRMVQKKRKQQ